MKAAKLKNTDKLIKTRFTIILFLHIEIYKNKGGGDIYIIEVYKALKRIR